ncbi:MAG: hypothetical protein J5449_08515 [Oscillospiraceae bacterium]|nr:hypothetical protein [Oscillospiraceae bacterium]
MEKKKTSVLRGILRTAAFALLFAFLFHAVSTVLADKRFRDSMAAFYAEPRNSVEVLLMGSSRVHNGISAAQLEEEFGIRANNFSQDGQVLPVTWYALREALRYQKPKVVVLDVYKVIQDSLIDSPASLHRTTDNMSVGLPRVEMIYDLLPKGERAEFLFNIITYHTRWKELTAVDFAPADVSGKGDEILEGTYQPYEGFAVVPESVTASGAECELRYLDKIVELCEKEGIELLLVSVPFTTAEDDDLSRQEVLNGMAEYAREKGLPYINMMHMTEELGFDFSTDMADMYHLNAEGMRKVTDWLGRYLQQNYGL